MLFRSKVIKNSKVEPNFDILFDDDHLIHTLSAICRYWPSQYQEIKFKHALILERAEEEILGMLKIFDGYWDLSKLMYEMIDTDYTLMHLSVSLRRYKIMWYFIETHKFDVDYYKEPL